MDLNELFFCQYFKEGQKKGIISIFFSFSNFITHLTALKLCLQCANLFGEYKT